MNVRRRYRWQGVGPTDHRHIPRILDAITSITRIPMRHIDVRLGRITAVGLSVGVAYAGGPVSVPAVVLICLVGLCSSAVATGSSSHLVPNEAAVPRLSAQARIRPRKGFDMAEAGLFRLSKTEGPAESSLWKWTLFDAEGTPVCQSFQPAGLVATKKTAEWIISSGAEFTWDIRAQREFDILRRVGEAN